MLRYLGLVLSATMFSITSFAASISPSQLKAGEQKVIKILDDEGKDITSLYDVQVPVGITLNIKSGKPNLLPVLAGNHQIIAVPKSDAPEIGPLTLQVIPGNASKIVIEDGNNQEGIIGEPLPLQLKAKVVDAYNNAVSGVPVTWTLSSTNSKDGLLTPDSQETDADGISAVTFTMGSIPGNQQVKAEGPATLKKGRSVTFSNKALAVAKTDAKKLAIDLAQNSVGQGEPFSVSVSILDAQDQPFSGTKQVSVKAYKNNFCSSLAEPGIIGSTEKDSSNGSVVFSGLILEQGGDYYIGVEVAGLPKVCSSLMTVVSKTDLVLSFDRKPETATVGVRISPEIQVKAVRPNGLAPTQSVSISIASFSDSECLVPTAESITGSLTKSTVLGKATFSQNTFPVEGDVFIQASSGTAKSSCEKVVVSNPNSGPAGIAFSSFSSSGKAGKPLSVQPKVNILDSKGYKLTEGSFDVKLSAFSDSVCSVPAAGVLTASNSTSLKGTASFSGVTYNKNGDIYLKAEFVDSQYSSISVCSRSVNFSGAPEDSNDDDDDDDEDEFVVVILPPPTNVVLTRTESHKAVINFDLVAGANDGYFVEIFEADTNVSQGGWSFTFPPFVIEVIEPEKSYYAKVSTFYRNTPYSAALGDSAQSNIIGPHLEPMLSIVGKWMQGDEQESTVLEFKEDGSFVLESSGEADEDGYPGTETGSYVWNNLTGALTKTILVDGNGEWGFSHIGDIIIKNIDGEKLELWKDGVKLTELFPYIEPEPSTLPSIVGNWKLDDDEEIVTLTFRPDGTYTQYQEGEEDYPYYYNGSEDGTYVWNNVTGLLIPTVVTDNNGESGLSHPEGDYYFIPQPDGNTMFLIIDGEHFATFLRYEPEEPPVESSLPSIVGNWKLDDDEEFVTLAFREDGTYTQYQEGEEDYPYYYNGSEDGTYVWNNVTGLLIPTVVTDNNGESGLSHPEGDYYFIPQPDGNTMFLIIDGEHFATFLRYEPEASTLPSIIGHWKTIDDDEFATISFREDGTYTQYQEGEEDYPHHYNGSEDGTYVWNNVTGLLIPTIVTDNNGKWGLSHPEGDYHFIPQPDGNTMFLMINGEHVATFLRYEPEEPPVESPLPPLFGEWRGLHNNEEEGVTFSFNVDGTYRHYEYGEDDYPWGYTGQEIGTFIWDNITGITTITVTQNDNGDWGFSDEEEEIRFVPQENGFEAFVFVGGEHVGTLIRYEEPELGTLPSIIGHWKLDDDEEFVTLTFRPDGTYTQYQEGEEDYPYYYNGSEDGTYVWNNVTGLLIPTVVTDNNGESGLSHPEGDYYFIPQPDGNTMFLIVDGEHFATFFRYTPGPGNPPNSGIGGGENPGNGSGEPGGSTGGGDEGGTPGESEGGSEGGGEVPGDGSGNPGGSIINPNPENLCSEIQLSGKWTLYNTENPSAVLPDKQIEIEINEHCEFIATMTGTSDEFGNPGTETGYIHFETEPPITEIVIGASFIMTSDSNGGWGLSEFEPNFALHFAENKRVIYIADYIGENHLILYKELPIMPSIVGTYKVTDWQELPLITEYYTFREDGTYSVTTSCYTDPEFGVHCPWGNLWAWDSGYLGEAFQGEEHGLYTWDNVTGKLDVVVLSDTNGAGGLSGWNGYTGPGQMGELRLIVVDELRVAGVYTDNDPFGDEIIIYEYYYPNTLHFIQRGFSLDWWEADYIINRGSKQ